MATKNVGGRPPKYTNKEEIIEKIDNYFKDCDGELLRDPETGEVVLDKFNNPIFLNRRPPTSAGLARALGFKSRTSLFEYRGKKEFKDVIDDAILRLEERTEERLFDRDGSNGAKFSLQNNFRRWNADKEAAESRAPAVNIICDIPKPQVEVQAPLAQNEQGAPDGKD